MKRLVLAVAAAWALATSSLAAPDPRIARVEQDLSPALQVKGRAVERHTLAQEMALHHTPAVSVAVIDGGRIVWAKAYGLADVEAKRPATVHTTFQAGSISKPVAASGAMQLVQAHRIDLDRPVNDQLKSWKLPDNAFTQGHPVTVRNLWTHTGGLTVHGFPGYAADAPVPTVVQVLEGKPPANTRPVVVDKTPGTAWRYSGGGITIAQLLMTDVTGKSFPEIMRQGVFAPLGMTDSSYEQPPPPKRAAQAATGYLRDGKPVVGRYHIYPEMAAAGLWTTPTDLAKWAIALQQAYDGKSSRLMSQASARTMLTPGLGGWGIGVQVEGSGEALRFEHGGDDWGFKANLVGWMSGGRGVIVMANGDGSPPILDAVTRAVAREYGWKGFETKVVDVAPLTEAQRQELVGSYGGGLVKVVLHGDRLEGIAPGREPMEIIPQGGDKFIVDVGGDGVLATLQRGPDGKIAAINGLGPALKRDP
jgi:CubicO group peptidase (beta-lactamase class C family)